MRNLKVPRGVIKKISAGILLDQDVEWQGKGKDRKRVLLPPSPEKLKTIQNIVSGMLGISADRGDVLVVESLPFEQTRTAEETSSELSKPSAPGKLTMKDLLADKKILIGAGAGLVFVVLLLGFMLRRPKAAVVAAHLQEKPMIMPGSMASNGEGQSQPGNELEPSGSNSMQRMKRANGSDEEQPEEVKAIADVIPELHLKMTSHTKVLLDHLRKTVSKDPEAAANVIRSWMEEV